MNIFFSIAHLKKHGTQFFYKAVKTLDKNLKPSMKKRKPVSVNTYMKRFLTKEKIKCLNDCYYLIRDKKESRYIEQLPIKDDATFDSLLPLVSLVIFTANKIECDALAFSMAEIEKCPSFKRKESLPILKNATHLNPDAYIYKWQSSYILHLHAVETGAFTPGGSSDLTRYIVNHPLIKPNCILSFGICYGRDYKDQNLGDVIIPRKLYPWSIAQKIDQKSFKIKRDDYNIALDQFFNQSELFPTLRDYCNGEDGKVIDYDLPGKEGKSIHLSTFVRMGNMSTGEAVVSSADAKDLIKTANRNEKELGGEMEAYGIAKECTLYANLPCFIIKSICDWGEKKDIDVALEKSGMTLPSHLKDKLQAYAAFCAGAVLLDIIKKNQELFHSLSALSKMVAYRSYDKSKIIGWLRKHYSVNDNSANEIFALLKNNHILFPSEDNSATQDKYYKKI